MPGYEAYRILRCMRILALRLLRWAFRQSQADARGANAGDGNRHKG